MLDHTGLAVTDLDAAKTFYVAALQPLGLPVRFEVPDKVVGFGVDWPEFMVHVGETRHSHISFTAPNKEVVNEFHANGLASGGKDNGAPGYRKNIFLHWLRKLPTLLPNVLTYSIYCIYIGLERARFQIVLIEQGDFVIARNCKR